MLLSTQGNFDPLLSVVLANILILGGRIPILMGLARFWNQEDSRLPLFALVSFLLAAGAIYYFSAVSNNMVLRIRIYSTLMVLFSLANIYLTVNGLRIERRLRPVMSVSGNFGASWPSCCSALTPSPNSILMVVRTGELAATPEDGLSLLFLGSIFTTVIFAFAIIIMTMEELTVEHKETPSTTRLPPFSITARFWRSHSVLLVSPCAIPNRSRY